MSKKAVGPTIVAVILFLSVFIYNQGYLDPFLGEPEDARAYAEFRVDGPDDD
jgi:hypothetical protein